jgi:hypothetical protein
MKTSTDMTLIEADSGLFASAAQSATVAAAT